MSLPATQRISPADARNFRELVELGREEISRRWFKDVQGDQHVPSTQELTKPLLMDCVPDVLEEILRAVEFDGEQVEHQPIFNAARHGRERARQHFEVKELVREYQLLRKHIFIYLQEHLERLEHCGAGEVLALFQRVGLAIDQAMRATIEAFVSEHTGELRHLSRTDSLTGLYNHRTFYERLAEELKRAARYQSKVSVAIIDLDNFKEINDARGHQAGDRLLVRCAEALREALRETDIICRYGGDEFGIIFPETAVEDAARLIGRLEEPFKAIRESEDTPASFGMSFGIAAYPEDQETPVALVRAADGRLLEKKQALRRARDSTNLE